MVLSGIVIPIIQFRRSVLSTSGGSSRFQAQAIGADEPRHPTWFHAWLELRTNFVYPPLQLIGVY